MPNGQSKRPYKITIRIKLGGKPHKLRKQVASQQRNLQGKSRIPDVNHKVQLLTDLNKVGLKTSKIDLPLQRLVLLYKLGLTAAKIDLPLQIQASL